MGMSPVQALSRKGRFLSFLSLRNSGLFLFSACLDLIPLQICLKGRSPLRNVTDFDKKGGMERFKVGYPLVSQ